MSVATAQVPLARFAHNWVGGNIDGLAQLADTLYGYAPQISGVAGALDTQVRQVVGAAAWKGPAAAAFTTAWGRDSATARAVGLASDQIAGIVGWLAGTLSRTEAMLEDAASEAAAHGVPIGADGAPPQACLAGPAQQWLSAYQKFYAECMQAAHSAREQAAGALATTARQITDPKGRGLHVAGDSATAGDLLADLLASPSATVRAGRADLAGIEKELGRLSRQISEAGSVREFTEELSELGSKLKQANIDMSVAQKEESALGKLADIRMGEAVQKAMKALQGGGAHVKTGSGARAGNGDVPDGDGDLGGLAKIARIGEDIPVVDVGAAALSTGLGTWSDVQNGQSPIAALYGEGISNTGGLGAAAAVADAAGGPAGLVAGVVLPDVIHNGINEPWIADVQQHGVVGGWIHGESDMDMRDVTDIGTTAWDDSQLNAKEDGIVWNAATEQADTLRQQAEQVWHDIF